MLFLGQTSSFLLHGDRRLLLLAVADFSSASCSITEYLGR
jgi:hypothetical protein